MGQRRAYRIETWAETGTAAADPAELVRHAELLREIRTLRDLVRPVDTKATTDDARESYRKSLAEVRRLKVELDAIHEAIERTKREIVTLHKGGAHAANLTRVSHELDAVVGGTEQATEAILQAAEAIDEDAATLVAKLSGEDQGLATDIQERVVRIFEACNFQDLTGQRISKVVATLRFVEERIGRMIEIWGGLQGFDGIEPLQTGRPQGDQVLLNGPSLATDADVVSQDDIDALFA